MALWRPDGNTPITPIQDWFDELADSIESQHYSLYSRGIIGSVADLNAVAAVTTAALMLVGDLLHIQEGDYLLSWTGSVWRQVTTSRFASASARTTAYAKASSVYLKQGVKSSRADNAYTEEMYLEAYNVSTNVPGSRIGAGWYPLLGRNSVFKKTFSQVVGSNAETDTQAGFTDIIPMYGFTEATGVFTVAQAGLYQLDMSNYNVGATSFGYVHVTKNGTSTVIATSEFAWGPAGGMAMHLHELVALAAGDTIRYRLYQNTGVNQTIAGTFSARYVGPE